MIVCNSSVLITLSLDALQNDAGFRLNPELYKHVLIKVDELKNNDND